MLDEVEELRSNFRSCKTMKDKRPAIFKHLRLLLRQASYIWAADADLDVSRANTGGIRFLESMLHEAQSRQPPPGRWGHTHMTAEQDAVEQGIRDKQFFLMWNTRRSIRRRYYFHPSDDEASCVSALVAALRLGRRVVVVTNSREKALFLAHHCRYHPQLAALFASGERSLRLLTGDTPQHLKWQFMQDKLQWRVDLLIYSPVISSGVDYSLPELVKPWFHEAFLFAIDTSSTVRQMFQQLNRVRQLSRNVVHVHLGVKPEKWKDLPDTLETVRAATVAEMVRTQCHLIDGHALEAEPDPRTRRPVLTSDNYNEVYVLNKLEENRSRRSFASLLQCAILSSGGTILQMRRRVSEEEKLRMKADKEQLKEIEYERIARADDWTAEYVAEQERRAMRGLQTATGYA